MAKASRQSLKLLYLRKILHERTDDGHRLNAEQLVEALEQYGISAERKSIYQDIDRLAEFGEDILRFKGRTAGFALGAREFELAELRLLVDIISSSRFLTPGKSQKLIRKVERLTSRYEAAALDRQVHVAGRVRADNEAIFYNIDALHAAMAAGEQVSFRYFKWTLAPAGGFRKTYRHDGARYAVSPWALIWDNLNYYLAAYDAQAGEIRHYRVDKMEDISRLPRAREGKEAYDAHHAAADQPALFGMFNGQVQTVTLRALPAFADVLRDRFGDELHPLRQPDGSFTAAVRVVVSPQFFGWIAGLDGGVWITAPEAVAQDFRARMQALSQKK